MTKTPISCGFLAAAALLFALSSNVQAAGILALDTTDPTGVSSNSPGFSRGSEFTLSTAFSVDGLGYFDLGADGLADVHDVGIFTTAGVLVIGPVGVSSGDPLVPSASPQGDWRVASIAPVVLAPGDYVIAGYDPSGLDEAPFQSTYSDIPQVTRTNDRRFLASGGLVFPTTVLTSTFTIVTFTGEVVPEPSTFILSTLSLLSLGMTRRRRRR